MTTQMASMLPRFEVLGLFELNRRNLLQVNLQFDKIIFPIFKPY